MQKSKVAIRTKRLPGHAWQENELYEVFWPIVGPQAGSLFCFMTRLAYGAEVDAPLRELAQMSGYSKDTVRRSVLVMEAVGMVRRKSAGKYELVDLKLLIHDLGGVFLRSKALYELPVSVRDRLRGDVKRVLAESQKKSVSVRDKDSASKTLPFVSASDASRDKVVSSGVDSVSSQGHPLIQDTRLQEPIQPPTPFAKPKGEARKQIESVLESDAQAGDDAVQAVMDGCSFIDPPLRLVIAAAMSAFVRTDAKRRSLDTIAAMMVKNWRDYCSMGELLRYTWSPRKFFAHGHWCNCDGWPVDQQRLSVQRNASVGRHYG